MPVSPILGQTFRTSQDLKVYIAFQQDPDENQCSFIGQVRTNGDFTTALYRNNGVCPANSGFNLKSLWPADDVTRYQPLVINGDGTMTIIGDIYVMVTQLKQQWRAKTRWAAETSKGEGPVVTLIDLDQVG